MIGFIMYWLKRLKDAVSPLVVAEGFHVNQYLKETGWAPDFNYLDSSPRDEFGKRIPAAYAENTN